jgi:hypothetical protein
MVKLEELDLDAAVASDMNAKLVALLTKHGITGHTDPGGVALNHPTLGGFRMRGNNDKEDHTWVCEFLTMHGIDP